MERIVLFLFIGLFSLTVNGQQKKIYTLTEVDVAPKFKKGIVIDSLTSHENFKRNLRNFIARNLEIIKSKKSKIEKAYVQFLVRNDGKIEVIKLRGTSRLAKRYASRVIKKIHKLEPALKAGEKVSMKYTIPVKFVTLIGRKIRRY